MGSEQHRPEPAQPPDQPPTDSNAAAEPAPRRRPSTKRRGPPNAHQDVRGAGDLDDLATMYGQLRDMCLQAFASGHLAVAYHALAGALHAAQDLDDFTRLEEVENLAREQMEAIDKVSPESLFSTKAAGHRGAEPLWATVARHAEMSRHLLRTRRQPGPLQEWR